MKSLFTLIALFTLTNVANAEVITLKCEGKKDTGEPFDTRIVFSPDERWARLDSVALRMTDAVSADYIDVFLWQMRIDRKTGEFTKGKNKEIKGVCIKNDTKF